MQLLNTCVLIIWDINACLIDFIKQFIMDYKITLVFLVLFVVVSTGLSSVDNGLDDMDSDLFSTGDGSAFSMEDYAGKGSFEDQRKTKEPSQASSNGKQQQSCTPYCRATCYDNIIANRKSCQSICRLHITLNDERVICEHACELSVQIGLRGTHVNLFIINGCSRSCTGVN